MGLAPEAIRTHRQYEAYRNFFLATPCQAELDDKADLHAYAADHLGRNALITYLEFGVANGDSLRRAANGFRNPETRLIGFDSFYGLPADWPVGAAERRVIPAGTFSRGGKIPDISDPRVSFVTGWFQNSVPEFLTCRAAGLVGRKVLVHFDADLYTSTLFLLSILWPIVPEYYFIMDDFFQDDIIALCDFASAYPVKIEWVACRKNPAGLPAKVFAKMRRTAFELPASGVEAS